MEARMIEVLPDKETFYLTPCPKCGRLLGEHVVREQWEPMCDVNVDDLVNAGLARVI